MKDLKDYTEEQLQRELARRLEIRFILDNMRAQWISPQQFLPTEAELACEHVLILQYDNNGYPIVEIGEYGDAYGRGYNYWLDQWGNDLRSPEGSEHPNVKGWLPKPKAPDDHSVKPPKTSNS